ncbi:hypothetical protein Tco_1138646 [Tanacetum coccineum]
MWAHPRDRSATRITKPSPEGYKEGCSEEFEGFSDSNDDSTSIDDDSFSIDDIDYVEASPPDSELVSLEEVKDFHTEDGEIEDDILSEKLSKINLLIAKIEAIERFMKTMIRWSR